MKNCLVKVKTIALYTLFIIGFSGTMASAHDMWIEVRDYTPHTGEEVTMTLGYGHYLPAREFLPQDYLDEIYVLNPKAKKIDVKKYSEVEYKVDAELKPAGSYLVVAAQKGRFWTKTTEGYQSGKSKKGLKDVISCTYSAKFGKAIVNMGKGGEGVISKPVGHELEIIPLKDPAALRVGDPLPVKILFREKPVKNHQVLATYVGFSRDKNTFAYATKTNAQGVAVIKMLSAGAWLVATHQKDSYPDISECDTYSLAASLTFEIQ
jgi:uncharacterized GH25 family protein